MTALVSRGRQNQDRSALQAWNSNFKKRQVAPHSHWEITNIAPPGARQHGV